MKTGERELEAAWRRYVAKSDRNIKVGGWGCVGWGHSGVSLE